MRPLLQRLQRDDEGASLILALVFIAICGVFIVAALTNGNGATLAGERVVDRTKLQYALDAGVSRAINVLQSDAKTSNPNYCPEVPTPPATTQQISDTADPGGFIVNGYTIGYRCQTLSGGVKSTSTSDSNYGLTLTSSDADALTTQSGTSEQLTVDGSVYLAGDEPTADNPLKKSIQVNNGSIVEGPTGAACVTDPTGTGSITSSLFLDPAASGKFKGCTQETLAQAIPSHTLPGTPPADLSAISLPGGAAAYDKGYPLTVGGKTCRVFVPGTYKTAPTITTDGDYFLTGYYYFDNVGKINIVNNSIVRGGQPASSDPTQDWSGNGGNPSDSCKNVSETQAKTVVPAALLASIANEGSYDLATGVEWVLGGTSYISVSGGTLQMNKPCPLTAPTCPNGLGANDEIPVSIYQSPASTTVDPNAGGLPSWATARPWSGTSLVSTGSQPVIAVSGQIYAPDSSVSLFTSKPAAVAAAAGIVANTISLDASVAGTGNLNIAGVPLTKPQAPPKRVIQITSFDASAQPSKAINVALITLWNYSFRVDVHSWRTG